MGLHTPLSTALGPETIAIVGDVEEALPLPASPHAALPRQFACMRARQPGTKRKYPCPPNPSVYSLFSRLILTPPMAGFRYRARLVARCSLEVTLPGVAILTRSASRCTIVLVPRTAASFSRRISADMVL